MSSEQNSFLTLRNVQLGLSLPSIPMEIARRQISSPEPLYEILLTGVNYDAETAYDVGLITKLVNKKEDLQETASDLLTDCDNVASMIPFQLMKKYLKEGPILQMRESGESKMLDGALFKQLRDPAVKKLIEDVLAKKKSK
jgi:enoyl-CoA hydratase/carnithine racemase